MKYLLLFSFWICLFSYGQAQTDTSKLQRSLPDTAKMQMNMDAVYNRPFMKYGKIPVAIGGYMEANTHYASTDGVSEGFSFQMRRMTLFVSSSIHAKIKFLSEIEFEDGTKEINIEFASLDIQLHPLLNFRGGIIMNPIGSFNQNHDGPRWEFIDRPVSSTQLLPATFSNVGFGFYGKIYKPNVVWGYECYLTNGFNDNIIGNRQNKTFLPATKLDPERFEESFNGEPMTTIKTSFRYKKIGELGLSYMGGTYNKFQDDGLTLDKKRRVDVLAIDFNSQIPRLNTIITTEFAWTFVDVPESYSQQYGNKQHGGFMDIVQPIIRKKMVGFEKASFNAAIRLEYVDWNAGRFRETGGNIADELIGVVPGISFRTSPQTVLRLNYGYQWQKDIFGNPARKTAILQFGISSYF
jgi:hypothetical protein